MAGSPAGIRFADVGYCIYCGTTTGDLTLEHIVAKGLGGTLKLPKASCEAHRRITSKVERYCLREMFGSFRLHTNLNQSAPPPSLPHIIIGDGGTRQVRDVAVTDYPYALALACFPQPGILAGREPTDSFQLKPWFWVADGEIERQQRLHGGAGFSSPEFHPTMFCRMLAKIALGFAVAMMTPKGISFEPLVRDLIVRGSPTPFHLVGGDLVAPPAATEPVLHELKWRLEHPGYLVVTIRLFAELGTPLYHVVVGKCLDESVPISRPTPFCILPPEWREM